MDNEYDSEALISIVWLNSKDFIWIHVSKRNEKSGFEWQISYGHVEI